MAQVNKNASLVNNILVNDAVNYELYSISGRDMEYEYGALV